MPPEDVLWDYSDHTAAKHRILTRYLQAWYPILSSANRKLNIIDGFAGPGRYKGGEKGSPLLMLDTYLDHSHRGAPAMQRVELAFDFIENDLRRVDYLRDQLQAYTLPPNIKVGVHHGEFDSVMLGILDGIPAGMGLVPTFAFIDPFGYTGHGLTLSSRILRFQRCEALIYVPWPFVARFIDQVAIEPALTNLFGNDSWKRVRGLKGRDAMAALHEIFLDRVQRAAGFSRAFEIQSGGRGWTGYDLYFASGHLRGLEKFKEAMWAVDLAEGAKFVDSTTPGQLSLLAGTDTTPLLEAIRTNFAARTVSIEDVEKFVIRDTAFVPGLHLKSRTLKPAEQAGLLEGRHPTKQRRRWTYPDGTLLTFK